MRALLDTNILIHREANRVVIAEIGILFSWLDKLKFEKCFHPFSLDEIRKHNDPKVVQTFEAKLKSYQTLQTIAPDAPEIKVLRAKYDKDDNDRIDTTLLNEVFMGRVDILISEDKQIHEKAKELKISDNVFTISAFLEKVVAENPEFVDYKVLAVRKKRFGEINLNDPFFDSFKRDYIDFDKWFNKKADEIAYICESKNSKMLAFLYLKRESLDENYADIEPAFLPKIRLKIGTFKVELNGYKLGERFLKIVFDNAMQYKVDEIYVTIFDRTPDQQKLIELVQEWGFEDHGVKHSSTGDERVYVRNFKPSFRLLDPQLTYPYISLKSRKFITPIYPSYHTELFPDSILRTESPNDFQENKPNRNSINKVYISRSIERNLVSGDIIIFYRTAVEGQKAYYSSVITTIGIVQSVNNNIANEAEFIRLCRKRSVFSDQELAKWWNYTPRWRPFIVNFLYVYSFSSGSRLNRERLLELNIISDKPPRGFVRLDDNAFKRLIEHTHANKHYFVD